MDGAETTPKIEDVARLAQVSTATVSRALRGLPSVTPSTRERVLQAAETLNYVIAPQASRLAAGRTMTIAIVVPLADQWFYNKVVTHAEAILFERGYDTLRYSVISLNARTEFLRRLASPKRVDGIIAVSIPLTSEDILILQKSGVPVITIETQTPEFPSISISNELAAHTATQHLVDLGHRRIALISGLMGDPLQFQVPQQRRKGYQDVLDAWDIHIPTTYEINGNFSMAGGYEAMSRLLALPHPPTAVFALSDEMAIGSIKAVADRGMQVPRDVSIVGFDDQDVSTYIGLTTIHQPVDRYGELAAQMLLDTFDDISVESQTLPTDLCLRSTTAAPWR